MKFLLVLAVIAIAIWSWRRSRRESLDERASRRKAASTPPAVGPPQAMVRCANCGLHLPAADALVGPGGKPYCSASHLKAGETVGRDADRS